MVLPIRDDNPTVRPAIVTVLLVAANLYVFLALQPSTDTLAGRHYVYDHAAVPCEVTTGTPLTIGEQATGRCGLDVTGPIQVGRTVVPDPGLPISAGKNVYLAVVTSMFLHANLLHLLGNMLFLWIFGNNVEDRLGHVGFAAFYLVCGIVAAAVHTVGQPDSVAPVLGASGAIAGVMGAYLVWYPRHRVLAIVFPLFFLPFAVPAYVVLGLWFVLQFFTRPDTGIAWMAHVGGFVAGAVIAALLGRGGVGPRWGRGPSVPPSTPDRPPGPGGFRGGYPGRD